MMMCKYSHYFNSHEMMRRFFIVNHENYDSRTDFTTHPCIYCEYGTVIKGHPPTNGNNVGVIDDRKPASRNNVGNYCRQSSSSSNSDGVAFPQPRVAGVVRYPG